MKRYRPALEIIVDSSCHFAQRHLDYVSHVDAYTQILVHSQINHSSQILLTAGNEPTQRDCIPGLDLREQIASFGGIGSVRVHG